MIDPPGRPLAAPGEPEVAQEVPDRGDDLPAVLCALGHPAYALRARAPEMPRTAIK